MLERGKDRRSREGNVDGFVTVGNYLNLFVQGERSESIGIGQLCFNVVSLRTIKVFKRILTLTKMNKLLARDITVTENYSGKFLRCQV